jgi:hypothetical protein
MGDAAAIDTGAWTQGWVWMRRIWCCDGVRGRDGVRDDDDD